jgi:hypothetical protein
MKTLRWIIAGLFAPDLLEEVEKLQRALLIERAASMIAAQRLREAQATCNSPRDRPKTGDPETRG